MGHKNNHTVADVQADKYFVIDNISREIINTGASKKLRLIKDDHNSEVFTFKLPRYIEEHDMSLCNRVEVHYINIDSATRRQQADVYTIWDGENGNYEPKTVTDENTGEVEEFIECSWLISRSATKYKGTLSFALKFECIEDETLQFVVDDGKFLKLKDGTIIKIENGQIQDESMIPAEGEYLELSEETCEELQVSPGAKLSMVNDSPTVSYTEPVVTYSWNTAIYTNIVVLEGMDNSEIAIEPYYDILEQWWNKIAHADDTLYAITDEGAILDVTEKINGLIDDMEEMDFRLEDVETNISDNIEPALADKANDSEVVKLSGAQTIEGSKTFSDDVFIAPGKTLVFNRDGSPPFEVKTPTDASPSKTITVTLPSDGGKLALTSDVETAKTEANDYTKEKVFGKELLTAPLYISDSGTSSSQDVKKISYPTNTEGDFTNKILDIELTTVLNSNENAHRQRISVKLGASEDNGTEYTIHNWVEVSEVTLENNGASIHYNISKVCWLKCCFYDLKAKEVGFYIMSMSTGSKSVIDSAGDQIRDAAVSILSVRVREE